MKHLLIIAVLLLFTNCCYAQTEKVWTETGKLNQFEAVYLDEAGLTRPKSVTRFYRLIGGRTENFRNEAVYSTYDGLINGEYVFYHVSFSGIEGSFNIEFYFSAGQAYTSRGTYVVEGKEKLHTAYEYGTTAGTIKLRRNGKTVYLKEFEF